MKNHTTCLTDFHSIRPAHETSQEKTLEWIVKAHTQAESVEKNLGIEERQTFENEFREKLDRVGCKGEHISKRGHGIDDFPSPGLE